MTPLASHPGRAGSPLAGQATAASDDWRDRIAALEERLREAEETLEAIRTGEVDAVVVGGPGNAGPPQVYTLENADRPYRLLIEEIQEGALTLDPEGLILYCNRAFAAMLCVAPEHGVGSRLGDFLHDGAQQAALARLLARGRGRIDLALRLAGGAEIAVHLSLSQLQAGDSHGRSRILCGVVMDLTEREARSRELTEAYASLSREVAERERVEAVLHQTQKMEALGQLAGGVAHDFNNASACVLAGLALIEKRHGAILAASAPEVTRLLSSVREAAERGGTVAHRLLAFARREDLCSVSIDPGELMVAMRRMLANSLGHGVRVRVEAPASLPAIRADRQRLETTLLNLAINARDAMPTGGSVVLGAAVEEVPVPARAYPAGLADGRYLRIWVADTGAGMDAGVLAHATEPFFTTKPKDRGTGLGLAMAQGFAAQSGGALAIESAPGRGTTVTLWLPQAAQAE